MNQLDARIAASRICKANPSLQHATNDEHKACPSCFPMAKEVNCRDCGRYSDGICSHGAFVKRVHANFACTAHTALKGLYP